MRYVAIQASMGATLLSLSQEVCPIRVGQNLIFFMSEEQNSGQSSEKIKIKLKVKQPTDHEPKIKKIKLGTREEEWSGIYIL